MDILINAPFNLNDTQDATIRENLNKLERYNAKITKAQVFFKQDAGQSPDIVVSEIQIHVPGPVIFASDSGSNAMDAFSKAMTKADRLMRKAKEIRNAKR